MSNLTLPNGVTGSIGEAAFEYCFNLTTVTIPGNVTYIPPSAFTGCTNLTNVAILNGVIGIGDSAFSGCASLTNVTISGSVLGIVEDAFYDCSNLTSVFFEGNPPAADASVFFYDVNATVYYLPGTTGWTSSFAGRPAVLWNPQIPTGHGNFGLSHNQFGFNITGTPDIPIVLEANTDLTSPVWTPLQTLTLTNGSYFFSEPFQTNSPGRFYRISAP